MTDSLINYHWELFIAAEVISFLSLALFLFLRYAFRKTGLSLFFLGLFAAVTLFEALLAWVIYQETGEISTFQIIVVIFIVYAFTFGISDFKKLDRWIKKQVGRWKNEELLTDKDKHVMGQENNPAYIARKNRRSWYCHLAVFAAVHYFFWIVYGNGDQPVINYLTDLSWWESEDAEGAPFNNPAVLQISRIWTIILIIDTVWSLSYTIFPAKRKEH